MRLFALNYDFTVLDVWNKFTRYDKVWQPDYRNISLTTYYSLGEHIRSCVGPVMVVSPGLRKDEDEVFKRDFIYSYYLGCAGILIHQTEGYWKDDESMDNALYMSQKDSEDAINCGDLFREAEFIYDFVNSVKRKDKEWLSPNFNNFFWGLEYIKQLD